MARLKGSIEKKKTGYLMRVTVGYNHKGNPDRISKMSDAATDKQAEIDLMKWITELEYDGYNKPKSFKFQRFFYDEWSPYAKKELAYKTWKSYYDIIEMRFLQIFKNKEMSRIKKIDIIKIMDNLKRLDGKKGPLAKSTKVNILSAIQSVFDYALYLDVITDNPAKNIKVGKDERNAKEIVKYKSYSTKEISELFNLISTEDLVFQTVVSIAVITGAREGEIAALETKHINKKDNTITFQQTVVDKKGEGATIQEYTKNHVDKVVHVPESLIDMILSVVKACSGFDKVVDFNKASEFIFKGSKEGKPVRADSLLQKWRRFCNRSGLRYIRFHDLRHTSATYLLSQTGNLKAVQERLGHKDYLTTANFYAHILEETDRESSAVFDQFLQQK